MRKEFLVCLFSLCCLLLFAGCLQTETANKPTAVENVTESKLTAPGTYNGCYQMVLKRDTSMLQLNSAGDVITGSLFIKPFEKDKSNGTIQGKLFNNNVRLFYTFQSEGTVSVREVFFKISNSKLIEGFGETVVRNDTSFFVNAESLQFNDDVSFNKIDCK